MTKSKDDWKKEAIAQIKASRKITDYRGTNKKDVPYRDYPNYDVFAFNPDLETNPDKIYYLSGTENQIILQSSLITSLYQILGDVLGYGVDFGEWFRDFQYEFKINPLTGRLRDLSNNQTVLFWGKDKQSIPAYEWVNDNFKDKLSYKVIKFWRNRKQVNDFIIFGGTETEIRNHLLLLMELEKVGGESDRPDKKVFTELKQLSSSPCIYLVFREKNPPDGETRKEVKIVLNLIDCVENSKFKTRSSDKVLGVPELKEYKKIIESNFLPKPESPYIFKCGRDTFTYANWRLGYHSWSYFINRSSAIDFWTKACLIKGDNFNEEFLYEGKVSAQKYNKPEEKIYVMGEEKTLPKYRRLADCEFWKAYLWLPYTRHKITLVSRSVKDPVDNRLL